MPPTDARAAAHLVLWTESEPLAAPLRTLLAAEGGAQAAMAVGAEAQRAQLAALAVGETAVVVLACATLTQALASCQQAFSGPLAARREACHLVVLCPEEEVGDAFHLCQTGCFDDYVPFWPRCPDPLRLRMAVRAGSGQAARRAPVAVPAGRTDRAKPLLLLVDDDPLMHKVVSMMLAGLPLELVYAASGEAGLQKARQLRPDLVLMDIQMPGMDGIETVHRLRADDELALLTVVMLTGLSERARVVQSLTAGASGFLVKPCSRQSLLDLLQRHLPGLSLAPAHAAEAA